MGVHDHRPPFPGHPPGRHGIEARGSLRRHAGGNLQGEARWPGVRRTRDRDRARNARPRPPRRAPTGLGVVSGASGRRSHCLTRPIETPRASSCGIHGADHGGGHVNSVAFETGESPHPESTPTFQWALAQHVGNGRAKCLLLMLAVQFHIEGRICSTARRLAANVEMSEPVMIRALDRLKELNLVAVVADEGAIEIQLQGPHAGTASA